MDYVVGSVAALITSGNVTPNRPRPLKRALTPTKHQPSPNVTPKSEFVDDRSIFLSPTLQKKKAIVKKSPKRIFQNPDLDVTNEGDGITEKAEKVKKHLKEELDADKMVVRSPKKVKGEMNKSIEGKAPKIKKEFIDADESIETTQSNNENTPKKKKKQRNSVSQCSETVKSTEDSMDVDLNIKQESPGTPKKKKKQKNSVSEPTECDNKENLTSKTDSVVSSAQNTPKKKKKRNRKNKSKSTPESADTQNKQKSPDEQDRPQISKKRKLSETITWELNKEETVAETNNDQQKSKKKNKRKKKSKLQIQSGEPDKTEDNPLIQVVAAESKSKKKKGKKNVVNTNKITNKDNDSDGSDNEIDLEDEANNEMFKIIGSVDEHNHQTLTKKNKKKKKSKLQSQSMSADKNIGNESNLELSDKKKKKKKGNKSIVNPNAITSKDTDSEHESDNEINSENEEANNEILNAGSFEESSDEDDEQEESKTKTVGKKEGGKKAERVEMNVEEELKRTLFVGNVVYSPKCKKEIKKIFAKHGDIETVRVRTVPVKDARLTPKVAAIKNELHPERTTVNAYVKFRDAESVDSALLENNTLYKDKHLRVTRSISTGDLHDPKASVFVGNLPFGLEDEGLWEKFQNCGEIESVRIVRDKKTSIGKGFGYVNFKSKDAVELALALTEEDLTIKNRILRVKRCTHTNKQTNKSENSFNNNQNRGPRDHGRGRGFNRGGRGMNRAGQRSFSDRGQGGDRGGFRGGQRGGRGGQRGGRGGQRGGRGGQRGGRGGHSFNNRGEDGQMNNFQRGRTDKDDIGAFRRIQNKRQYQERGADGPPSKKPRTTHINQPQPAKDKKPRKEFVGMTAEKKKKHKNTKSQGLRQKKALSEILSK